MAMTTLGRRAEARCTVQLAERDRHNVEYQKTLVIIDNLNYKEIKS